MQPLFSGPNNYDYITVIEFNKLDTYMAINYNDLFEKHWGKDKVKASMERTDNTRDMIGNEIWYVAESIGGNSSK
jgi:hypothetical protein